MSSHDPLGIDWGALAPRTIAVQPASATILDLPTRPWKEPDAVVLVIRRMTCKVCHSVSEAPEQNLFTRQGGHFRQTRQGLDEFPGVGRETKVLHLPAEYCGHCFRGDT